MKVYIVGEDPVTYAIIKRVIDYCSGEIQIIAELPARGGEIKNKIPEFNKLSSAFPVILLTDLDSNPCAPILKNQLITFVKNDNFLINVAVDEAEAWLMADRKGFAEYFLIDIENLPKPISTRQGGRKALIEMDFPYKSSMYLTHELIKLSKNISLKEQFTPKVNASKGPEYNTGILPFIQNKWNINQAKINSDSLNRMITRIKDLYQHYS
jgi:hypothetical protein